MGSAYTPGLQVSRLTRVRRIRRLATPGEVLARIGDVVHPDSVLARALLPGFMQTVKVAANLGIEAAELLSVLQIKKGDTVEIGQVLAVSKSLFGLLRTEMKSPVIGTVETISAITGNLGIRLAPTPIELTAYLEGTVVEVLPREGAAIEADAALIQGIFGVGGERVGEIAVLSSSPEQNLVADQIVSDHAGKILVGGSNISGAALRRAADVGVTGIIVGGIIDGDLIDYLGYNIGVAITGQENIPLSVMVTEGFGAIAMAQRTFDLLMELDGRRASMNGATQIRAGVIRPEIIVPRALDEVTHTSMGTEDILAIGTTIRIIRQPYFGVLATVSGLPSELVKVESGAAVRVLSAELKDGAVVMVPRANVEILKSG